MKSDKKVYRAEPIAVTEQQDPIYKKFDHPTHILLNLTLDFKDLWGKYRGSDRICLR